MKVTFQCISVAERDYYMDLLRATGNWDYLQVPVPGESCATFAYQVRRPDVDPALLTSELVIYYRFGDDEPSRIRWHLFDSALTRAGLLVIIGQEE
jgi:hypothetical protein